MQEIEKILIECIEIQSKKSKDYQNKNSRIKHIDYYPRGLLSIMEMIHTKTTRLWSLIEKDGEPNFESIEDNAKDLINYASFLIAYKRGKIDGQNKDEIHK